MNETRSPLFYLTGPAVDSILAANCFWVKEILMLKLFGYGHGNLLGTA